VEQYKKLWARNQLKRISPMAYIGHFTRLTIQITKRATAMLFYGSLPPQHVIWREWPLNPPGISLFHHHVTILEKKNCMRHCRIEDSV
jgi:hypothetical protein